MGSARWGLALSLLAACGAPQHAGAPAELACPAGTRPTTTRDSQARVLACARADGTLHGPWREESSGGVVEGAFLEGLPDGRFVQRSPAGRTLGTYSLARGLGESSRWYATGELEWRATLRRGELDGRRVYLRREGLVSSIEDWSLGHLVRATGRHYPSELDSHDQCPATGGGLGDGCPGESLCAVSGRELTLRGVLPAARRSAQALDLERWDLRVELGAGPEATVRFTEPLRFDARVARERVPVRVRGMTTLLEGEGFVRVGPARLVALEVREGRLQGRVDLVPGARLPWRSLRCEQLTLGETRSPEHTLERVQGDGSTWRARGPELLASAQPGGPPAWRLEGAEGAPSVRFARLERRGEFTRVGWQSWDWSALSGWVRTEALEPAEGAEPEERHASVPDREDCALAPGERALVLPVGARLYDRADGASWAEVTRALGATGRDGPRGWVELRALGGASPAGSGGACASLEASWVRAEDVRAR